MKATPVYAIETLTITLTRAEAEKTLTHPKPVQDLLAAVLQNGKAGVEHVGAEESPAAELPPVVGTKRPKKAPSRAKAAPAKKVECEECHRKVAHYFLPLHMLKQHGIDIKLQSPSSAN